MKCPLHCKEFCQDENSKKIVKHLLVKTLLSIGKELDVSKRASVFYFFPRWNRLVQNPLLFCFVVVVNKVVQLLRWFLVLQWWLWLLLQQGLPLPES
jgi:hypothetical protein